MRVIFLDKKDRNRWNRFILENRGSFLQSFEWGDIQEGLGRKVFRMWIVDERIDETQPIFCAQIIKHNLPFGKSYLYSPHGPIYRRGIIEEIGNIYKDVNKDLMRAFIEKKKEYFADFLEKGKDLCEKENAIFFKIEPLLKSKMHLMYLLETALKKSGKEIQPSQTIILDLEKSEKELTAEMKPKTRYNIRLAEKHGVDIVETDDPEYFEKFFELMKETAKRDGFILHPKESYAQILETKSDIFKNILYIAMLDGRMLAGAIINFFNEKAVYLHGASSSENRNVMAPYLLHWEIIKRAKASGIKKYDLWGISEKWPGVTRFKQGFGGKEIKYLGAFDLVVDRLWYFIYSISRRLF